VRTLKQNDVQSKRSIRVEIRSGASGTAKTYTLFQEWRSLNNCRKLYLSHSHEFLEEQYNRLKGKTSVRHWKDLHIMCPCLQKDELGNPENPIIAKLVDLKIPYDHICAVCKDINAYPQKDCPYRRQFNKIKSVSIVLAPIEYAFTKRIAEYKPHIIAVDDCLLRKRVHPTLNQLKYLLFLLSDNSPLIKQPIESLEELCSMDLNSILPKLNRAYETNLKLYIGDVKNNPNDVKRDYLFTTSPEEIETYCKQAQTHGFKNQFATPALFRLFDYVFKNKTEDSEPQLKIIEAKPNMDFLKILADRYYKEEKVTVNFEPDGFEPRLIDRGSVVYRMGRKGSWYPIEESIEKNPKIQESIMNRITGILEHFYNNNFDQKIGVIMKKPKLEDALERSMRRFVPKEFKNVKVETFGNLRGKNSLEHCNPLFVIGTYCINKEDMAQKFSDWFARDPSTVELVEKEPHGDYYHYVDKEMEILRKLSENYEMYQAIYRSRLSLSKKQVFVFGFVPREISEDGIKVERIKGGLSVNKKRREWLLEYMKKAGDCPAAWAQDDMAKELKMSKDYAYREIKAIVKNSENLRCENRKNIRWLVYLHA
jgi:hypothetical protein